MSWITESDEICLHQQGGQVCLRQQGGQICVRQQGGEGYSGLSLKETAEWDQLSTDAESKTSGKSVVSIASYQ